MAAAAAVSTNNTPNQVNNNLNQTNLMRPTLNTNNASPIQSNAISGLNSSGNSICSSLSSNSGSLKLMLSNSNANATSQNLLLSPSSSSAPSELLGDINYLNELFNSTSLGNSTSLNSSSQNLNSALNTMNSNLMNNSISNSIKPVVTSSNQRFVTTPTSFLDMNSFANFSNANNVIGSGIVGNKSIIESHQQQQENANQQDRNQTNQANQNSPPNGSEKQSFDSFSMSNAVYPNQYQHLLVAN